MNKIFRNKRIVFVWFVSYMVILFLSVLVNFIAYLRIESSISLQNSHYVTEILENRKNGIDNLRKLAGNIAMEISHNREIEDVAISKETKGMAYQEIIEVSEALSVYKNIEGEFNDIYVYFQNSDYCTGLFVCNDAANFYNVHIGNEKMERSRWFELMRSNHTGDFVVEYARDGKPYVAYMLSIYGSERFIPYATVVVELDYTKFFPVLSQEKYNESFYIIDENNRILMSENRQQETSSQQVFDKYGIRSGISPAGKQVIVCANSENSEWKYVYLMDKAVFRKTINQAREIILIFNLLCIIIASLIAWVLTKRNYKPVGKILNIFGGDDTKDLGFNYIENKVNDIVRENRAYSRITEKLQDNVVKGAFISRLLTEKLSISNKEEILDALGISFAYSNYMVVLFYVEMTEEMFFDDHNDNAEEAYRLARLALTNVMGDLITDSKCTVQYCDIEGMLGCIVNLENKDSVEEFADTIRLMQKMLHDSLNIEFMAGLSNVYGSLDMLPECYNEAMRCVEQYFFNANDLVRYSDLEETAVFDCYISETAREQLVAAMQTGNYEACEGIINRIFDKNIINAGKSVRSVKFVLYEIAATMIRTITEIGNFENEQKTVSELVGMIENAGTGADAPEIREHILSVIKSFCEQNAQKPVQKTDILAEKAKHYVDENYSNPELTVAKIAEHCNVSMAYLSTSFKKKYNAGLLEYINYVRIDHAKKILADETYTVERVAEMVGYNNTRSYFRMFSRFVGTSPHKYRTMILSGGDENK